MVQSGDPGLTEPTQLRNGGPTGLFMRSGEMRYTPLGDANRDIRWARRRHILKRLQRWRITSPIQMIDGMLEDVEQMNMQGARRVPISWEPRLELLAANLPAGVHADRAELRAGISPNRLMEALFCLQDQLLDLKIGPLRPALREQAC
jgi:hypothetical protein